MSAATEALLAGLDFDHSPPCETTRCMGRDHNDADYLIEYTHPTWLAALHAMRLPAKTLVCHACWLLVDNLADGLDEPIAVIVMEVRP